MPEALGDNGISPSFAMLMKPEHQSTIRRRASTGAIVLTRLPASRREFASGALVQVLPKWDLGYVDVHAVFTNGRAAKPSARAIVGYFADILPRAWGLYRSQSAAPDPKLLDVPTTKVLAIGSFTPGTSPKVWLPMVPREAHETADLYFEGKIDQWYVKQDKTGVVFLMNAKTPDEAHEILDKLPMGVAGVMKFEMIPLGPISPLRMIMTNPGK